MIVGVFPWFPEIVKLAMNANCKFVKSVLLSFSPLQTTADLAVVRLHSMEWWGEHAIAIEFSMHKL